MSLMAVFEYEVEPAGAEAFEAVYQAFLDAHAEEYASRNETAKRLWTAERALGRFEAV
jgi:hypothetical protein